MVKRRQVGEHQSREQVMQNGFQFTAGGPDDTVDKAVSADKNVMATRKIAPLKRKTRGGPSAPLPNLFANVPTSFNAGANGSNASGGGGGFGGGFGGPAPAVPTAPAGGGFGAPNGGFGFGQQPEKPNPFSTLAPSPSPAPQTNGFDNFPSGGSFGSSNGNGFGFGASTETNAPPATVPTFGGFGASSEPAPSFNKTPDFSFGASTNGSATSMLGNAGDERPGTGFTFGATPTVPPAADSTPAFGGFGQAPPATTPATTAASSTGFGFGSNYATTTAPASGGGLFFGNTPQPDEAPKPFGIFGSSNPPAAEQPKEDKPPFGGSTFGGFGSPAPAEKKDEPPKPAFGGFGSPAPADQEVAKPAFGGFGTPAPADKEEAPKPAFGGFGTPAPADKEEAPKPAFGRFGSPAPAEKEEPPKPAFGGFGGAAPSSAGSLFGKPAENNATGGTGFAFGRKPTSSPEPAAAPAAPATPATPATPAPASSLFGKPLTSSTPAFGGFGTPAKMNENKDSAPKFGFGSPAKKDEVPKTLFGTPAPSDKNEAPKSLFGTPVPEKNERPKSVFDSTPSAPGSSLFASPKQSSTGKTPLGPASGFAFGSPAKIPPTPQPFSLTPSSDELSNSMGPPPTINGTRVRSPPLPPDAGQWSASQLTEYYNLFALRSLNHAFKEQLTKVDVFADLTPLCRVYQAEAAKIKDMMDNNIRYKFEEARPGSSVPGKRTGEDIGEGGGKRSKTGVEENKASVSSTSQFLASAIGGSSSGSSRTLAAKPAFEFKPPTASSVATSEGRALPKAPSFEFKPPTAMSVDSAEKKLPTPTGSVLTETSPSAGSSWVNPFAASKVDSADMSDDAESDNDEMENEDEKEKEKEEEKAAPTSTTPKGGLFDRIQNGPSTDKPSLFSSSNFGSSTSQATSLFGSSANANTAAPSTLFGNPTSSSSSLFGNLTKPNPPVSLPPPAAAVSSTAATPTDASETDGEPSDTGPAQPAAAEVDLSVKGPGEEDEDATFQARAIVYDLSAGNYKKIGVGMMRVLLNRDTKKARVIVRTDGGKVIMNVRLGKVMEAMYTLRDKVCLIIPEVLESGDRKTWGARVSKQDTAREMRDAVMAAL